MLGYVLPKGKKKPPEEEVCHPNEGVKQERGKLGYKKQEI